MSHEIQENDKQQGRVMAWHGLTDVKEDLSLENCWLSTWDYIGKPVQLEDGTKTPFCALTVSDVPNLFVGQSYNPKTFKPVTNAGLIAKLTKAIENQGVTLESCGTIMNRARQFFSFSLDAAKFQAAGREFKAFLNIGNGNDKSSPLWVNTSNICTVCNNTFTANLSDAGMIMSVKKTQFSEFKLAEMGQAIASMLRGQAKFAKQLNELHAIPCDEITAREFLAGFIGDANAALSTRSNNTLDRLIQLFKGGAGNDGNDYSDVFQALTDYYTHESAGEGNEAENRQKQFVSSEFGTAKQRKMEAWSMINDENQRNGLILIGKQILKLTAEKA